MVNFAPKKRMNRFITLLFVAGILACGAPQKKSSPSGHDSLAQKQTPPADDKSYLKKRPEEFKEFFVLNMEVPFTGKIATKKDVEERKAFFNINGDKTHKALDVKLPFFAFLKDKDKKQSKFVIILQAETNKGDTILGFKDGRGMIGICRPKELEFFEYQRDILSSQPQQNQ